MKEKQHVYLYIDDSGKLSRKEKYTVFAGIIFSKRKEKIEFTNKYKSIIKSLKPNYGSQEIKGSIITNNDRRRIIQLSKKFNTFGTIIYNQNLMDNIISDSASKGRFIEYAQRRLIKKVIISLISEKLIDPNQPIHLHINIDQMPTKSNGYYTLQQGLLEELKHGINNWNYEKTFPAIIYDLLIVDVMYKDSKYDLGIQISDILANTIRRAFISNNNWLSSSRYLLKKIGINILLRLPN